ncbi:hypothetical protein J31TS4_01110 [Paenibacillus sp. J31TS4]|uniref:protein-glutamate methylesterase/protein-glutamine glutaminase n=1 Tax=Paenibacillus sp. J31TS4 TaxID=2807195 RepID=UPI001B153BFA|nr:chemotaxis response regulator protein-glutamate methylesterase [Paenibacillus sp. J31TS4]GIP36831.1 hypothetical protein J31TS4_01110 [Paenibacillus sp. J31TS4]
MKPYQVLVVDDSMFMRKLIADLVDSHPAFQVVGTARNGREAVERNRELKPDVVTMDVEMPEMNGIEAVEAIMADRPVPIIMLSSLTEEGAEATLRALEAGAFDFLQKPSGSLSLDIYKVRDRLHSQLESAANSRRSQPPEEVPVKQETVKPDRALAPKPEVRRPAAQGVSIKRQGTEPEAPRFGSTCLGAEPAAAAGLGSKPGKRTSAKSAEKTSAGTAGPDVLPEPLSARPTAGQTRTQPAERAPNVDRRVTDRTQPPGSAGREASPAKRVEQTPAAASAMPQQSGAAGGREFADVIAIGTSTGGPRALQTVLGGLPASLSAPVLVVQHMPPHFTKSLANRLNVTTPLRVVEAEEGMAPEKGTAYIAPGGKHMTLVRSGRGYMIRLSEEPPRAGHRPSVDELFESLTDFRELRRHIVLLTGMGSDGASGMLALKEAGAATTIAEAADTCVVYGMPRSAIERGAAGEVLPLTRIATRLTQRLSERQSRQE